MTRALRALLGLVLLAALRGPAAAQTVTFGVARDGSALYGELVTIPVWADMTASGGALLGSYTVRLTFDPTNLQYAGIRPGTFAAPLVRTDSASVGVLRMAAAAAAGAAGYIDLGHLAFYAYADSTTTLGIEVLEAFAAGTFADLTPFVTTSPGLFCPALGRWGDVDADGDANSRDALAVLSHVVGITPEGVFDLTLGDTDGDGLTNTRDALILLSYAVGLPIDGTRVLTVAPGACAVAGTTQVEVLPDSIDLVPRQRTTLRVTSRDNNGVPTVLNALNWVVDDPRVGYVDATTGEFVARDTGLTTLRAALGPGIQAAVPVAVRSRRGTWHVNGQTPRGAIALGTAAYPFWTPQQAFPLLAEGDTIRVAAGAVDYDPQLTDVAAAGFVLVGDTLADGTRPRLRAPSACCSAARLHLQGSTPSGSGRRRVEYHHVTLHNFDAAIYAQGLSVLIMRNVRIELDEGSFTFGVEIDNPSDTVDLENVDIVGGAGVGDGVFLDGGGFVRLVDVTMDRVNYGLYLAEGVDTVHVANSVFTGLTGDALGLYPPFDDAIHALYVGDSRFVNNRRGLAGFDVERATLTRNVWEDHARQSIQLYAPSLAATVAGPTRYLITGDSVRSPAVGWAWLEADAFDTLLVADVHVAIDTTGVGMSVFGEHVDIRRSVLDGVTSEGWDLNVASAVLDTVSVLGCATCAFSSVVGVDVAAPAGRTGPTVHVRAGTLRRLFEGIRVVETNVPGPLTVVGTTIDSVQYGIRGVVDSARVDSNTVTQVRADGVGLSPSADRPRSLFYAFRRNVVVCEVGSGTGRGIVASATAAAFADNFVQDCDYGLYASNLTSTLLDVSFTRDSVFATGNGAAQRGVYVVSRWRPTLYGVRTRGAVYGIHIATNDTGTVVIDSSAVSQAVTAGIRLATGSGASVRGVRNNVTNNVSDGILNTGTGARRFALGRFVGNGRYAVNSSVPFLADSNWWGAASGPGLGTGDSVFTPTDVTTTGYLTAEPQDVPPPAPPATAAPVAARSSRPTAPAPRAVAPGTPSEPSPGRAVREAARLRKLEHERARRRRH